MCVGGGGGGGGINSLNLLVILGVSSANYFRYLLCLLVPNWCFTRGDFLCPSVQLSIRPSAK